MGNGAGEGRFEAYSQPHLINDSNNISSLA